MDTLQAVLDAAYQVRWLIVVGIVFVMGGLIAVLVGDRNFLEEENAGLRAENDELRQKRSRVVALPPRRGVPK